MVSFKSFIFSLFPSRFKRDDSYKNSNGEGLLERYCQALGEELDLETVPKITNYLDQIDPQLCDVQFINHLADSLGNPPDLSLNLALYRDLLSSIVALYKIKGTEKAQNLFFQLLGYNVILSYQTTSSGQYDTFNYDSGFYDNNCDSSCLLYDLILTNTSDDCTIPTITPIGASTLAAILAIITFLQPINSVLGALVQGANICETVPMCCREWLEFQLQETYKYDENLYDELIYDEYIVVSDTNKYYDCQGALVTSGIGVMIVEDTFIVT